MAKLPTELKVPSDKISDYTILIAGDKKVGKTSFATAFPKHFVLEFEPRNASHLNCNYEDIYSWNDCLDFIKELEQHPTYCQTLVLDDVPSMYQLCLEDVKKRRKLGPAEPLKFDGWGEIKALFDSTIRRIQKLPFGKIYTAHTAVNTFQDRNGNEISMLTTNMGKQCNEIMEALIHLWACMFREKDGSRILQLEGTSWVKAGHGFGQEHFKDAGGKPLKTIPLGNNPQEAYRNFTLAYNNQLQAGGDGQQPQRKLVLKKA